MTTTQYASFPKDVTCSSTDDLNFENGYKAGYDGTEYQRPLTNNDRMFYRNGHKQGMADKQAGVYMDNQTEEEKTIESIKTNLSSVGIIARVEKTFEYPFNVYTVYSTNRRLFKGSLSNVAARVTSYVYSEQLRQADLKEQQERQTKLGAKFEKEQQERQALDDMF